jgi:uncharacterized RDD family membrane protein YckC
MVQLRVETPEGVLLTQPVAGAGTRLAAGVLDVALIVGIYLTLAVGGLLLVAADFEELAAIVWVMMGTGLILFLALYHIGFHLAWRGQTPGKRLLGVRVMGADGYPPTASQVVIRGLVWPFDALLMIPIPVGLIVIGATARRQRLGDLVAGTLVVRDATMQGAFEPWSSETYAGLDQRTVPLVPGMAARLTAEDLEFMRSLLTRRGLEPGQRRRVFSRAARHYAEHLGVPQAPDPRILLREVYLFARDALRA